MALPKEKDSSQVVIRNGRFTRGRTKANPKTKALAKGLTETLAALVALVGKRNLADDDVLDAEAAYDFALETLEDAMTRFHNRAIGIFESKQAEGLKKLFDHQSPSTILQRTLQEDRGEVHGRIIARAQGAEGTAELKRAVKDYAAAHQQFLAAEKDLAAARLAFGKAVEKEQAGKRAVIVAMTRLQGQLLELFAEDRARVARFFLKGEKKTAKSEAGAKADTGKETPPTPTPA